MTKLHRVLFLPLLLVVLGAAAACGGESEIAVPSDAVAVVGEQTIPKTEFDALINQAKKSYEAQEREFPKAGTPEYETLKNQAIQFLVQRSQFEQKANELGVEVTDAQVTERLKQIKEQYFGGDEKKYADQLEEQGLTDEQVKKDIRAQLVQEEIFNKVTEDVEVTDAEVSDYYDKNKDQYGQPESRDVRHILVPTKAEADKLYDQLQKGGDFAKLAKDHSKDPGSAAQGGKLTIARGQTVEPFDQTAFLLKKGTLSKPVKTQYGYHLIEPVGDVKPAKTTPLAEVKESIKQQLLQTKRNEAMTKWVEETKAEFEKSTAYQVGFAPPATTAEDEGEETGPADGEGDGEGEQPTTTEQ